MKTSNEFKQLFSKIKKYSFSRSESIKIINYIHFQREKLLENRIKKISLDEIDNLELFFAYEDIEQIEYEVLICFTYKGRVFEFEINEDLELLWSNSKQSVWKSSMKKFLLQKIQEVKDITKEV